MNILFDHKTVHFAQPSSRLSMNYCFDGFTEFNFGNSSICKTKTHVMQLQSNAYYYLLCEIFQGIAEQMLFIENGSIFPAVYFQFGSKYFIHKLLMCLQMQPKCVTEMRYFIGACNFSIDNDTNLRIY